MRNRRTHNHRGMSLIYLVMMLPVLIGCCALAVDFGYVELAQYQLQQVADASAHDYMVLYTEYGNSQSTAQSQISTTKNSVFTINNATPVVSATWGYWSSATQTFSTTTSRSAAPAVKVTATLRQSTGNPISLMFARIIGQPSIGVSASAVAASVGTTANVTVSATSNLYLSGMPPQTATVWGDNGISNPATQVASIPVVPGSYLTFTTFTGTTSVIYPQMPYYGPNGSTGANGTVIQHGQNWDGPILSGSTENGIANAIMPESALVGLFLDSKQPDSTPTPTSVVDWTQSAQKNQPTFTNLGLKTPFFIGDGQYNGTTQTFQVPPGATRFYLGIWDGVEYNNNSGSLAGSVTVKNQILLVQ